VLTELTAAPSRRIFGGPPGRLVLRVPCAADQA
jgi:hypothetical protein